MRIPIQIEKANIEELLGIINKESDKLIQCAKKCVYIEYDDEIHRLLDEENLKRYEAVNKALAFPLKDFDYDFHQFIGTIDEIEEMGRLIQCWITLGSAVETSLQIFLSIYQNDYQKSNWGKWENFNYEEVKISLYDAINSLEDEGHIVKEKSKALKKNLKNHLKGKMEVTSLEDMNLQSLVRFFQSEISWNDEYIDVLNTIRENRNAVHSFKTRTVSGWDDLVYSLKFYCVLLIDLLSRMPPFDDVISDMLQYEADCYSDYYK